MNLDKLKALIRLANNNPNDNEANLAARRVCKIIAEKDFALLKHQFYQPSKKQEDFVNDPRPKTWNDVKRSPEPEFRSRTYGPNPFEEFFKGFARGRYGGFDWSKAPHKDAPEPDWTDIPFTVNMGGKKKEKRRQELRVCSKCGLETMTFRTDEVPWICNPCHWKDKL